MKKSLIAILTGFFALTLYSGTALAAGDAEAGAALYKKRCKNCHSTEAGKHKNGPSLAGVFGRKAGSTTFAKYKGLKGFDAVWNEESLNKFLTNPKKFVGAKSMAYKLKKENQRADVIEYLKTLK